MTSDIWVLRTVSSGYQLEFTSPPPAFSKTLTTPLPGDADKRRALLEEVEQLLRKNAIERIDPKGIVFYSTFFLTTKKSGEWRPILNLKRLNKCIRPPPFKMESLAAVLPELRRNWWGATLDLKDAYMHIPIHPSSKKWLGFVIGGKSYRFKTLPFGLSTAPRTFTRVVKVIAEHLRKTGVYVFVYLDDWLLTAPSQRILTDQVSTVIDLVQRLGFIVNLKKSALQPSQTVQFLGSRLDFASGKIFPTEDRVQQATACATQILEAENPPARLWLRLLGIIASLKYMLPQSLLRMRVIQLHVLGRFKNHRDNLSKRIGRTGQVTTALKWWTRPFNIRPGRYFVPQAPSSTLTTDASKSGWGAHWGNIQLSGTWSPSLAKKHINLLELWAIHLALRRLRDLLKDQTVLVKCDNMSVVMYINKRGGVRSRSLCLQTIHLLTWCHRHRITLWAAHLPGADNKLADALSRETSTIQDKPRIRGSSVEWHLNPVVCRTLFNRLQRPLIDLFASSSNNQLPTFCSWGNDPKAFAQDAMTISWDMTLAYAFPPIALVPRVLDKLDNSSACEMILITPRWPRQPWFPRLLSLLAGKVIALPHRRDLVLTQEGTHLPLQNLQTLNLTAWQLSSDRTRRLAFQAKLQPSQVRQGDHQQDVLTIPASESTSSGVTGCRLIHIEPL